MFVVLHVGLPIKDFCKVAVLFLLALIFLDIGLFPNMGEPLDLGSVGYFFILSKKVMVVIKYKKIKVD